MTYTITRDDGADDAAALRYALEFASVKHSTHSTALRSLADSIEEQVKPAIEEPTEWGSVIMARDVSGSQRMRWFRGATLWRAENHDFVSPWIRLTDVEVLRVGIGEAGASDFAAKLTDRFIYRIQNGITAERRDAYERAIKDVEELQP